MREAGSLVFRTAVVKLHEDYSLVNI